MAFPSCRPTPGAILSGFFTSHMRQVHVDRTKLLVVLPVSTAMFLGALDATLVGTAMPTVIASLGGLQFYAWVFAIYTLTITAAMPVLGRLSDLYGRRTLFLIAVGIFTAGSALCGLAQLPPLRPCSKRSATRA